MARFAKNEIIENISSRIKSLEEILEKIKSYKELQLDGSVIEKLAMLSNARTFFEKIEEEEINISLSEFLKLFN